MENYRLNFMSVNVQSGGYSLKVVNEFYLESLMKFFDYYFDFHLSSKNLGYNIIPLNKPLHFTVKDPNGVIVLDTQAEKFDYLKNRLLVTKNERSFEVFKKTIRYLIHVIEFEKKQQNFHFSKLKFNPLEILFKGFNFQIHLNYNELKFSLKFTAEYYSISENDKILTYRFSSQTYLFNNKPINIDYINKTAIAVFLSDPLKVIVHSNIATSTCCFCNKALSSKDSVINGYGKNCAVYFGLPYRVY
jgi:hypothetical protein